MANPEKYRKVPVLGVEFTHITQEKMVETLIQHVKACRKAFVVTANPEIVLYAQENQEYKKMLDRADYITADGIGVVKAAQLLGDPLPERVAGYDLFIRLLEESNEQHFSVYLLGAREEVLAKTREKIKKDYLNVHIAGSHHGFFDWEDGTIENEIKDKKPDFVFVALGFPRQEQWIAKRIDHFDQSVFVGIGGSFDVLSGAAKRAPEVWQKMNLEWFYRISTQPSRWKRALALPKFALKVVGQKVKRS